MHRLNTFKALWLPSQHPSQHRSQASTPQILVPGPRPEAELGGVTRASPGEQGKMHPAGSALGRAKPAVALYSSSSSKCDTAVPCETSVWCGGEVIHHWGWRRMDYKLMRNAGTVECIHKQPNKNVLTLHKYKHGQRHKNPTWISTLPSPTKRNLDAEEKLLSFPAHQQLYYTYSSTYPACSVSSASLGLCLLQDQRSLFLEGLCHW